MPLNPESTIPAEQTCSLVAETKTQAPQLHEFVATSSRLVGRAVLALGLSVGTGMVAAATEAVAMPQVAYAATEFVNDYPDMDAADCSPIYGADSWCKGSPSGPNSARHYGYRNCTDGVAYWVAKYTSVILPDWHNANNWDNTAPTNEVYAGTTNDIEPGDIAQSDDGTDGHVGFVTSVTKNGNGTVASFATAELNKANDGNYGTYTYSTRNAAGKFSRGNSKEWDHFIDVNGAGKGLGNENWPSSTSNGTSSDSTPPSTGDLSFVRLNHYSGHVEVATYSAASGYQTIASNYITAAPDMPTDGTIIVRYKPNNDLSFIRLNDPSGNVQILTYAANTGYQMIAANNITAYPDVAPDGGVVGLLKP